jgi:hypothetical protein
MSSIIELYYYATDAKIKEYSLKMNSIDKTCELDENVAYLTVSSFPLYSYDNPYKPIGILKRSGTQLVDDDQKNEFVTQLCTIYFYNKNDTVSFELNDIENRDGTFYPPNIYLNSVITSCSGDIYSKRGTVSILPLDNEIKTRIITINLY